MSGPLRLDVPLSSSPHEALTLILQTYWLHYGIQITAVDIRWREVSNVVAKDFLLEEVKVSTSTFPR